MTWRETMTIIRKTLCGSLVFFAISASAQAGPTAQIFATGASVGGAKPDSISIGGGSVWVEYGNGAASDGTKGSSTIVQYGFNGAVLNTYSIPGSVDGLKYDPMTGKVWALQNQDDNSTLSIIDPTTHTVSAPLKYDAPYVHGGGRGYDDVAFLGDKVYLSYTNRAGLPRCCRASTRATTRRENSPRPTFSPRRSRKAVLSLTPTASRARPAASWC
jgi:hypothetical protein